MWYTLLYPVLDPHKKHVVNYLLQTGSVGMGFDNQLDQVSIQIFSTVPTFRTLSVVEFTALTGMLKEESNPGGDRKNLVYLEKRLTRYGRGAKLAFF